MLFGRRPNLRFLLFTKTRWEEAPRLRHQVARLLVSRGHDVTLFERPSYLHAGSRTAEGIAMRRTRQLIHPQLRVHPLVSAANAFVEKREIRRAVNGADGTHVLNFNWDYDFLRDLFPASRIVTIFNDDFVASARPFCRTETIRVMNRTVSRSDQVLVTSFVVRDQLLPVSPSVSLFLPWARRAYAAASGDGPRRDVLYWGYISDRLDFALVRSLLDRGVRIHFAGPIYSRAAADLFRHPNAEYHGVRTLDELQPVVARCCCSIVPYHPENAQMRSVTISNRAFELLAAGLPLIYTSQAALLPAPPDVIYACRTTDEYLAAIEQARASFADVQPRIREYLLPHTADRRYAQLMAAFGQPAAPDA
jgi:hypothetical protein